MMARVALVRAVFGVLVALLATCARAGRLSPINTCSKQQGCIYFEVTKLARNKCRGADCTYKACLILDTTQDSCNDDNGKIATTCVADRNKCCPRPSSYVRSTNKGPRFRQCQIGPARSKLDFYLGDGVCDNPATLYDSVDVENTDGTAHISCRKNTRPICTRNCKFECKWSVTLPECPADELPTCTKPYCSECYPYRPYKCKTCDDDYGLVDGHCEACEVANCKKCDRDVHRCQECKPGYEKKNYGRLCEWPVATPCTSTQYRNDAGRCINCPSDCAGCDKYGCTRCTADKDVVDVTTGPAEDRRKKCLPKCTTGQTRNPGTYACENCAPPKYISGNTCTTCPGNGCGTCDAGGCMTCPVNTKEPVERAGTRPPIKDCVDKCDVATQFRDAGVCVNCPGQGPRGCGACNRDGCTSCPTSPPGLQVRATDVAGNTVNICA